MKVLIIAREDFLGAGKAALRIYECLQRGGHETSLLVQNKISKTQPGILKYDELIKYSLITRIRQFIRNRVLNFSRKFIKTDSEYYFFGLNDSVIYTDVGEILKKLPFVPHLIFITWTSQFFPPNAISKLQKLTKAKVIAYPMDMSMLTGGCHYAWNCEGYTSDCSGCPAILTSKYKNLPLENLKNKLQHYTRAKMKLVVGSSQLFLEGEKSSLFRGQSIIPKALIPIDDSIFNTRLRSSAKEYFGIPKNKKVIFFGSSFTLEKRKGVGLFLEVLKKLHEFETLSNDDIIILIGGNTPNEDFIANILFEARFTGYMKEDRELSLAYQASDVFVSTSIQDSGPMMINESIMCGTPVVSFSLGVARDLVVNEKSGFQVDVGNLELMATCISKVLNLSEADFHLLSQSTHTIGMKRTGDAQFLSTVNKVLN